MLAELTGSRSNVKKLSDQIGMLAAGGENGKLTTGKDRGGKEGIRRSSLTTAVSPGAFKEVKEMPGKNARSSPKKGSHMHGTEEGLLVAREENERLRGLVEAICCGLGLVQSLWPRGLPVPLSAHIQGEVSQKSAMEARGNLRGSRETVVTRGEPSCLNPNPNWRRWGTSWRGCCSLQRFCFQTRYVGWSATG